MRAFMATNPREGRPPHQYTLEEFGLTAEGIARDFAEYRERFILQPLERRGRDLPEQPAAGRQHVRRRSSRW